MDDTAPPATPAPPDPPAGPAAAADWYPDPTGTVGGLRYWDGVRWSPWVAHDGVVALYPLRAVPQSSVQPDQRGPWPVHALGLTIAVYVCSLGLEYGLMGLGRALGWTTDAQALWLGAGGLYAGLTVGALTIQRRWGTDRGFARDLGLDYRKDDVWIGLLGTIVARAMGVVAAIALVLLLPDLDSEVSQVGRTDDISTSALIAFVLVAVVVAPFIEELFFRGIVLRVFEQAMPGTLAVVVQGVLFGLAHLRLELGWANVFIVVPIALAGTVLGWLANRYHRLGPGIAAHAWFNLMAVALLLLGLAIT
jgi:membrane protease YdiL (CAAX protease family)